MNNPCSIKMTAIIPNYNSVEFLPKSIQSLLDQTEAFDEIIIIDDGSTDNSITVIESYIEKNPHIRLIKHEKNRGVIAALNTGIEHATGDFLLLGAADDWYGSKVVALAKEAALQFPEVGVICGDAMVERFDMKEPFYRSLSFPANTFITPQQFKELTQRTYVGFNSSGGMFMSRQAILNAGNLHPATRWHCDWLLYFVVALRQGVYYFNEIFIHVKMRKLSYSEGKQNKKIQDQVMLDTVCLLSEAYPDLWNDFKRAALVPHHALRYVPLFLSHTVARKFISFRFMWKMAINNEMVVRVGRLFPYDVILKVRKFLRA
ncbi:MAG: glycosyltransferase family 2 protein [Gammaproteobacteria bacterium]|nr:glycosyltransferase family 2 protein [Gammaproteobacteria bacterium]